MTARELIEQIQAKCDPDDRVGVEVAISVGTGVESHRVQVMEVTRDQTDNWIRCIITAEEPLFCRW